MTVKVKICGISKPADIDALIKAEADYAGFVFFEKSPRHLTRPQATELAALMPENISKVALFVNPDDETIKKTIDAMNPDYLQLHGSESPERVAQIKVDTGLPLIKAFGIAAQADLNATNDYADIVDMFLFDAKPASEADLPGGRGRAFDWQILKNVTSPTPWMLSGGLTVENVAQAVKQTGAMAVDVSSGVESAPGEKAADTIAQFVFAARRNT